jgi:hypothetical protein
VFVQPADAVILMSAPSSTSAAPSGVVATDSTTQQLVVTVQTTSQAPLPPNQSILVGPANQTMLDSIRDSSTQLRSVVVNIEIKDQAGQVSSVDDRSNAHADQCSHTNQSTNTHLCQLIQPVEELTICLQSSSSSTKNRCLGYIKTNADGSTSWQCEVACGRSHSQPMRGALDFGLIVIDLI